MFPTFHSFFALTVMSNPESKSIKKILGLLNKTLNDFFYFIFFFQNYFTTSFKKPKLYLQTFGKAAAKSGISGYGILEGLITAVSYTVSGSFFFMVNIPNLKISPLFLSPFNHHRGVAAFSICFAVKSGTFCLHKRNMEIMKHQGHN